ncbi:MAG: acyl-CoA dehydrogenase family protein, partial [Chloroflexota bacterium]
MNGLNSEASLSLLNAARALAPRIAAAGDQIEAERRLPEPLVGALVEAGLFKMLLPRSLGGGEADLLTFLQVLEHVATADGSVGWCLAQNAGRAALVLRLLRPDVARRIFGDPRAIIANGTGASGRATEVEGGYSLEGEWPFASGCTHTTWLMGAAAVYGPDGEARRQANGAPDTRMLLVPTFAARIVDTWQVSGLRGTGSHTVAVTGLFVPHDQTASPVRDRRAPAGPLDAIPDGLLFAAGFSAVTMGIARGALDAFIALAAVKKPRDARRVLQEDAVVQTEV